MKKIFITVLICSCEMFAQAQTLTPTVISTAGTSFVNGGNVLDWTLGEPATFTLDNGTNSMTQGFHQNDLLITEVDAMTDEKLDNFKLPLPVHTKIL